MLKANKSAWFEKIFRLYNRNLLERRFHSLQVYGSEHLKEDKPLIIYANHSSWWDGLVAFQISQAAKVDAFVMMEEKQLKNLFFFRWLGAFSVVREKPKQAVESLQYAVNLLQQKPNRTLWIFPQGKILPNDFRPLEFYTGASRIVERVKNCSLVPLAIRYEFLGEYKPRVFVKIGEPQVFAGEETPDAKILTREFERRLTETLDELKSDILVDKISNYAKII